MPASELPGILSGVPAGRSAGTQSKDNHRLALLLTESEGIYVA